jgi:hypothetical protein
MELKLTVQLFEFGLYGRSKLCAMLAAMLFPSCEGMVHFPNHS